MEAANEVIENSAEIDEIQSVKVDDKFDKDDYKYLRNSGFSSEIFKIELKNLPKFYGYSEVKKLINTTLNIDCHKIKIPRKNSPFAFICMKNDEDRGKAIQTLNGYKWKGNVLKAIFANPAHDPLVKQKRRQEQEGGGGQNKKQKTVAEGSEPLGHLEYTEQLEIKQKKIEEIMKQFKIELRRANNIQRRPTEKFTDDSICELQTIVPSPLTEGYRNKCEFSIGRTVDGEVMVGNRLATYASGSTAVASIEDLKMPTGKMKLATKLFRDFVVASELDTFNAETYQGHFRNMTIRETREHIMIIIGIHPQTLTEDEKEKFQNEIVKFFTEGAGKVLNVTSIYYEEIEKRQSGQQKGVMKHIFGATHISETILGLKFRISPNSFFQANTLAAEKLYQLAIELAEVQEDSTVLDICCGTGTIGLCFAKHCKKVFGMEIIPEAIEDANENAKDNGIKNADFTAGNADDLIHSIVRHANVGKEESIVAIVDPPRAGLQTKSIQQLRNAHKITKLVYISCSPNQALKNFVDLCKNCSKTMRGDPFVPKIARAVDMFPGTPHCELVVLFERTKSDETESAVKTDLEKGDAEKALELEKKEIVEENP